MKAYMQQSTPEEREKLAKEVGSTVGYFYQIAGGHKRPGPSLCKSLVAAEPRLTLGELRPDIWTREPAKRRSTDKKSSP
ncbi:MAG: hypothetical protein ACM34A_12080 [Bacillota bacterium]